MIVVYPKEFKENAPENCNVIFGVDNIENSGLYDQFYILVEHENDSAKLNYISIYDVINNIHFVKTKIDCRYSSNNLDMLIKKFKKIEEVWHEG